MIVKAGFIMIPAFLLLMWVKSWLVIPLLTNKSYFC